MYKPMCVLTQLPWQGLWGMKLSLMYFWSWKRDHGAETLVSIKKAGIGIYGDQWAEQNRCALLATTLQTLQLRLKPPSEWIFNASNLVWGFDKHQIQLSWKLVETLANCSTPKSWPVPILSPVLYSRLTRFGKTKIDHLQKVDRRCDAH